MKTNLLKFTCGFALLAATPGGWAQSNLILNGNFATGNFQDWNENNMRVSSLFKGIAPPGTDIFYAATGNLGALMQTINTMAGTEYTLSFLSNNNVDNTGGVISGLIDGSPLFTADPIYLTTAGSWEQQTYNFTATADTTAVELDLNFLGAEGYGYITDISVVAAAPVPEPSTLALAGLGGLGMWWQIRRRK